MNLDGERRPSDVDNLSPAARSLWAKTGSGEQVDWWSPLYVHLGDSAEAMRLLWRNWLSDAEKCLIADKVGSDSVAEALAMWLAAVHDIGKATPAFQYKVSVRADLVRASGLSIPASSMMQSLSHAFMGQVILDDWLCQRGWTHSKTFSCIVGGHHGAPPDSEAPLRYIHMQTENFPNEALGDDLWQSVQDELLSLAFTATGVNGYESALAVLALPQTVQVLLTGLVIMSDWIASNADFFPLISEVSSLREFRQRAQAAWIALDLPSSWHAVPCVVSDDILFRTRFSELPENATLLPAQYAAMEAARQLDGPGLIIIEAPMGSGKTEASLLCAEILAGRFGEGGVSYLLPTMATSNAMFSRVQRWLRGVPDRFGDVRQSLQLVHGKAALNSEFARLKAWAGTWMGDEAPTWKGGRCLREEVIAHQWFGGRKRGLLASFVVGTVDQLLMAALKTRHVQLRHLGLAGKVVIVDEVHAYDAYMSVYLNRVMAWLGAYGVSTVLLSATLPPGRRMELIRAYRGSDGRRGTRPSRRRADASIVPPAPRFESGAPAYPLVTSVTRKNMIPPRYQACSIETSGVDVQIEYLQEDDESLLGTLQDAMVNGGCICVLRDTVRRAQATYELISERLGVDVRLVHSRFIAMDRMANDAELLSLLGPGLTARPEQLVVVGTQVIEQSLDIDFDLMITDVAPIDLLLQRMGRLHRHQRGKGQTLRPPRLQKARCLITGARDWSVEPPAIDESISHIYPLALLWRSVLALRNHVDERNSATINLPHDIAPLVERVYERHDDIPKQWREKYDQAQVELDHTYEESQTRAKAWLLGRPRLKGTCDLVGWLRESLPTNDETVARATVRDTQESLEVVAVQGRGDDLCIFPWVKDANGGVLANRSLGDGESIPDDETARLAASCTVSLPPQLTQPWNVREVIAALEARWPVPGWQESRWLKGQLPIVFDAQGDVDVVCSAYAYRLHYSQGKGLEVIGQNRTSESER